MGFTTYPAEGICEDRTGQPYFGKACRIGWPFAWWVAGRIGFLCNFALMKRLVVIAFCAVLILAVSIPAKAQCSVCTRTAQQLGEKSAKGLNAGIMYLAFTPLALIGIIGYRWWKKNKGE